jgi:ferredoxin
LSPKKHQVKTHPLKNARRLFAVFSFALIFLLFADYSESLLIDYSRQILWLQFLPSLIHFLTIPALLAAGWLAVFVLTFLFGRVYCSAFCPLGIFQDLLLRFRRRWGKRIRYHYDSPSPWLLYGFSGAMLLFFVVGIWAVLPFSDPYAHFGRMVVQLVRPLLIYGHNGIAELAISAGYYQLFPVEYVMTAGASTIFALMILLLLVIFTWWKGRLFCNSLCPVGALLGLVSRFSLFSLKIDGESCTACGLCERVCRANCIDSERQKIDMERCVACYDCLGACNLGGIAYTARYSFPKKQETDQSRRHFLAALPLLPEGVRQIVVGSDTILVSAPSTIPEKRPHPVLPPGAVSLTHYLSRCTACQLCVSACPTHVLQPSFLGFFPKGIFVPEMDNVVSYCNYDCIRCSEVCPTGAIIPQNIEEKKLIQTGVAVFIEENCIVFTQKTECGACAEHCPTQAVKMVLDPEKRLRVPVITEEICVGCGACEHACPTRPYRAIYVKAHSLHKAAEKPQIKAPEIPKSLQNEEFPF